MTTAEVAAQIAVAIGRPVPVVALPPARLAAALVEQGAGDFAADAAELCADVATGALAGTTDASAALTGRASRTFAAFAAANVGALSRAVAVRA